MLRFAIRAAWRLSPRERGNWASVGAFVSTCRGAWNHHIKRAPETKARDEPANRGNMVAPKPGEVKNPRRSPTRGLRGPVEDAPKRVGFSPSIRQKKSAFFVAVAAGHLFACFRESIHPSVPG